MKRYHPNSALEVGFREVIGVASALVTVREHVRSAVGLAVLRATTCECGAVDIIHVSFAAGAHGRSPWADVVST